MNKRLKGCLLGCAGFIALVVLGVYGFISWFKYTSPVLEAGREYTQQVKRYQGEVVTSKAELNKRLEILDEHFESPTFDKMQGGKKTEVLLEDIQKMFGEPDQVITNEPIDGVETVYQYHIEDMVLNFHESVLAIEEFVTEEFTQALYDEQQLNDLFLEAVNQYTALYGVTTTNDRPMVSVEIVEEHYTDLTPTRVVKQAGWFGTHSPVYYYDDGLAEFSPEEYVAIKFSRTSGGQTYLSSVERQKRAGFDFSSNNSAYSNKVNSLQVFSERLKLGEEAEENADGTEKPSILLGELTEDLGDYAKISHEIFSNSISVYWYFPDGDMIRQVIAKGKVTGPITDLSEVEITRIDTNRVSERNLLTEDFISSH